MAEHDHLKCVAALTAAGFLRATIINKSYQCMGASSQTDVATAWKDDDQVLINENQQLQNEWPPDAFYFYKTKWTKIGQSSNKHQLDYKRKGGAGPKGENHLLARDRDNVWIIVTCSCAPNMATKKEQKKYGFKSLPKAMAVFEKILSDNDYDED